MENLENELLISKLTIPVLKSKIYHRGWLINRLQNGIQGQVTLLVAPTGYGKTTLLADWISSDQFSQQHMVWFSLDPSDNDLHLFWSYLLAGLKQATNSIKIPLHLAQKIGDFPEKFSLLNPILNQISQFAQPIWIFFDNYHVITNPVIQQGLWYLIDHQPENLHIVISSRCNPPFQLSRLRSQNRLSEINQKDFALSLQESHAFVNEIIGASTTSDKHQALIEDSEGWIAGLQLIGRSIILQNDPMSPEHDSFPGEHEIIAYLFDEVLKNQGADLRDFLIQTSILPEFSAALCNAILGLTNSDELINRIIRSNLFISSLDYTRTWYRYHPIFCKALSDYLRFSQPERYLSLNQKACEWLRENNNLDKAVYHALAIDDIDLAAEIVNDCAMQEIIKSNMKRIMQWIDRFPDRIIEKYPRLGIYYGIAYRFIEHGNEFETKFRVVEKVIRDPSSSISSGEREQLSWELSVLRGNNSPRFQDIYTNICRIKELLQTAPDEDIFFKGSASHILADYYFQINDLERAATAYETAFQYGRSLKYPQAQILAYESTGLIRKYQGHLNQAEKIYKYCLEYADQTHANPGEVALVKICLLNINIERNDFHPFDINFCNHLIQSSQRIEYEIGANHQGILYSLLANYFLAINDIYHAHQSIQRATDIYKKYNRSWIQVPIEYIDVQSQLWIETGDLQTAKNWLQERITLSKSIGKFPPGELMALTRVYFAENQVDQVLAVACELEKITRQIGMGDILIKALIQQAIAYQGMNDIPHAFQSIENAIELAATEGYMRVFVEKGIPMMNLLDDYLLDVQRIENDKRLQNIFFIKDIINSIEESQKYLHSNPQLSSIHSSSFYPQVSNLSERELEVYNLLCEGKSTKEIALLLKVSINTIKTHLRKIYQKLGVHSWKEVIQLDLPSRSNNQFSDIRG